MGKGPWVYLLSDNVQTFVQFIYTESYFCYELHVFTDHVYYMCLKLFF